MKMTRYTNLEVTGCMIEPVATVITKSADYTLTAEELNRPAVVCTMSAASKSLTLGVRAGQVLHVVNAGGTNAFTVKGQSGDTGTSLGAGKVALVIGSATADETIIKVLN